MSTSNNRGKCRPGENAPAKDLCKGKADLELSELSLPQQVREKFWQEPRKRLWSGPRRCREAKLWQRARARQRKLLPRLKWVSNLAEFGRVVLRDVTLRLRPHHDSDHIPVTNNLASGTQSRWYVQKICPSRIDLHRRREYQPATPTTSDGALAICDKPAIKQHILTMHSSTRSVTPPPTSSRPSPPALAVPTSVFLSRTPARPPRPSTAGRSPALSSTSRTSRATPRPSP